MQKTNSWDQWHDELFVLEGHTDRAGSANLDLIDSRQRGDEPVLSENHIRTYW
jgi:hypothetical protein